ncbi:MAG TPA: hypothetical protein VFG68_00640 [Fimbriiglobus sp.]|nr:hypothetical protein [Fimbriiglobus sp.]
MHRITIFHHPDCVRCHRIARVNKLFDWLGRLRISTAIPPTGPLQPGEIAVRDDRTGETVQGVRAARRVAGNILAYLPLLPLLYLPPVARWVDRSVRPCEDGSCAVPAR